jgi:hypothetical protein
LGTEGGIMSKFKALAISTGRATGGMAGDILEMIADAYFVEGLSLQASIDLVQDQLVQRAIDRYAEKIGAALARAGLEVDPQNLTLEGIKAAIVEKTGLDLSDLSPAAMAEAVDKLAAQRLSAELGIEIATVAGGALQSAIKAGVAQAIADGRVSQLVGRGLTNQARAAMTWQRAGFDPKDRIRIMGRIYQKRYRRHNVEKWD